MKKKLLCGLLALCVLLSLTACAGEPENQETQKQQATGNTSVQSTQTPPSSEAETVAFTSYVFLVGTGAGNFAVEVNADMAGVLESLGEPQSYFEAESCAFQGLDKTYTYAGFVITTRPDGDKDFISSIRLTDDSVTTMEGIYIGCSRDEVIGVYGPDSGDLEVSLVYVKGDSTLTFIIQDDKVISIEYLPA